MSQPPGTGRPIHVMAKAAGAACNMRCDYCYYLEKEGLYSAHGMPSVPHTMSQELLELYIRQYIEAQPPGIPVTFTWHGGEALLRPLSFYQCALELQRKYAGDRPIENALQTNGLLLSPQWCTFLRNEQFLVGISLDGTKEQHDRYRRTTGGAPTFDGVMRGVRMLQDWGVEFNILSTVNSLNADDPLAFYHFLKAIGNPYLQFTPIVERIPRQGRGKGFVQAPYIHEQVERRKLYGEGAPQLAPYSVTPEQWGFFTTTIFDEWVRQDVGHIFVQLFDATLAGWMGASPGVCLFAPECGHAAALEHNGDLYSCDHFVYPRHRLGNIQRHSIRRLMDSGEQLRFGRTKRTALTKQCRSCAYLFACHGECPKNRFERSLSGEPGHNYLCGGYYRFFDHVAPYMDYMKACLLQDLPPAQVMYWARQR